MEVNFSEGEKVDLEVLVARLHKLNRQKWMLEVSTEDVCGIL